MIRVAKSISRDVFLGAIRDVVGEPSIGIPGDYHFHGRTDRSIYHDICAHANIAESHAQSVCHLFEEELEVRLRSHVDASNVELLSGVTPLLESLHGDRRYLLGLLTGNIEPCARIKLGPHDLNRFFPFGAFGSDHRERNQLPPFARRRAEELMGEEVPFERMVIIGDSPRDIECARAWDIPVVAVATGGMDRHGLEEHAPDLLLESLDERERLMSFLNELDAR